MSMRSPKDGSSSLRSCRVGRPGNLLGGQTDLSKRLRVVGPTQHQLVVICDAGYFDFLL